MRNKLLILLVVLAMLGTVNMAQAQTSWACPEGFEGQTLRVFNWGQYVAETTIADFEELCGVTVEYFEFGSNDQLLTVMQAGTAEYDVVVPTADLIPLLTEQELIQPLDHSRIPNIENIGPIIDALQLDPGHQYSAAYQWGTIGFAYDATVIDTPITSWDEFFAYPGRVSWFDDSRLMLKVALQKLGYSFSSIDEGEIQEAADYLLTVPESDIFAISPTPADLLLQGEVDAIVAHSRSVVNILQACECEDFVYAFPSDGFVAYYDAMVIPTNAPNPDLAHAFIDYILDPQVNADLSNALGSGAPNEAAQPFINEDIQNNGISYPDQEMVDAFLNNTIMIEQAGQAIDTYVEAWNRVKAELVN